MGRRTSRVGQWLTVAVLVAAGAMHANGSTRAGYRSSGTVEARQEPPPEFRRVCVRCHASDRVVEGRRYRSQWDEVLDRMVTLGAKGTDEDFEIILGYLVREFGRVSINTAAAEEIAQVLHLKGSAAEAIVQHRTKHGKFADFEALAAVPGVPVEELRKRRDAIVFQ
jgi:competence ComEA-like helix-hairpin-helix protein